MRAKIILGADSQECLSELCQLTDSFAAATQNHHHYDDSKFNDEDEPKFNGKMRMMKTAGVSIVSSQSGSEEVCHKLQEANCHHLEDDDDDDDDENHEDKKDEDENYEKAVYQNFASSTSDTQTIWQN